ncbi:MAG: LacI family DNA-binding transcriptional regulator [Anaerolineaceae bacterium]|nr:LacI family DNA-binding transcriptional regulator [Anaerolineaceae bacterium]
MTTLKDVARAAGVSAKTVSRVVNNDRHVSDALRQRVLRAIEDLDYRPNLVARHMRTQKTRLVGLVTDEIGTTPFSGNLLRGAQEAAWQHGLLLLACHTGGNPETEAHAVDLLLERQVEGIIFAAMYHREVHPPASLNRCPAVLLDCFVSDNRYPAVLPDERDGGYQATRHLLQRGCRRIAMINGKRGFPGAEGRAAGYRQALAGAGLELDDSLLVYGDWWQEHGYGHARRLLDRPQRPDAIFCGNDRIAMGVFDALRKCGLRIPQDVAVIGFDNMELIAAHSRPGLTTMALPHHEMGRLAMELLNRRFEGDSTGIREPLRVPCPLVRRESA